MKPTIEQIKSALRITGNDLDAQIEDLIDPVHAEMLAKMDRKVYADADALAASQDATGIVVTKDMINAQILLIGFYLDQVGTQDGERTRAAVNSMFDRHRLSGA